MPGIPPGQLRVLIAGGGVAALETALAVRALAEERVAIELLSPEDHFVYRPLLVAEPFGLGQAVRIPLADLCECCEAALSSGTLVWVDPERRIARSSRQDELEYDVLVVACGARPRGALPGALTFASREDVPDFRRLLEDAEAGLVERIVFAVPGGTVWPLPLYELALLTAAHFAGRDVGATELEIVTHERAPLGIFGDAASEAVRKLLDERGVGLRTEAYPVAFEGERLWLVPAESVRADRVVALPRLEGPYVIGLPRTPDGFVPVDATGRVDGLDRVFAAGDATSFPVKQGGIAAQQADAVAEAIAELAGASVVPRPFEPVLRGLLLTGAIPHYLRAEISGGRGDTSEAAIEPLWWPPAKVAGRYLGPFLAEHSAGAEIAAAAHPSGLAVEVDVRSAGGLSRP
jgi:sulfide:quinone oxidoreductase